MTELPQPRLAYGIKDALALVPISRAFLYNEIKGSRVLGCCMLRSASRPALNHLGPR
jgi:hypothetical protein